MISQLFGRMPPKTKLLGAIGGLVVVGSIFKVAYFRVTRGILVEQAHQTHRDATANYREAKEFAKWSAKDREERRAELPPLTPEQEKQMKAYLRLMREHHALNPDSEKPGP